MANQIPLIVYPIKDADKAKKFYSTFLGTEPYMDSPYYIGYKVGDGEVGLDPHGQSLISYIDVDDIEDSINALKEVGGEVVTPTKEVGGGLKIAQVKDTDGNVVGFRQHAK
jgi:predicted enzyme related to lactoylglutathione lyase